MKAINHPLFIYMLSLLFIQTVTAQIIPPGQVKPIAENLFMHIGNVLGTKGISFAEPQILSDPDGNPAIYIFSESKGGFIILSGEKKAYPLLGFSGSGYDISADEHFFPDPSTWPSAFKEWINSRIEEIIFIRQNNLTPYPETTDMWQMLEKGLYPELAGSKAVAPLLTTTWNQGCGYNAQCPSDSRGPCSRVYTGCVATAMAQVIRYNQHPVNGTGNQCYTTSSYGQLCSDFATANYNYSIMPNNSGNAEVAKLMYHCGVAVSMNYGPYGSSAYSSSVVYAMRTWFDYTNGLILSKGAYTETNWATILRNELNSNRPVYYSGQGTSGHAFVLDGYKETNHFHVNWGWGGSSNGYFYLASLNPGSMNFSSSQQGIVGMIPTASFRGLDFSSAINLSCKTPVNGNIATGTNYVNYYKNTYPATPGKELVYSFTTTLPGRIRIKISNQTESVYTFLLNQQNKDSLVSYGTNGLTFDNSLPGTYYISVEGTEVNEPTFTIEVICPTTKADLDIQSASVSPRYIQSMQSNVSLTSRIRNIGNTPSASCTLEYFLSDNATFEEGTDLFLGDQSIPALGAGNTINLSSAITMPPGLVPGSYYVIFAADRGNIIPETDDENYYCSYVTVPELAILRCSSAHALSDGVWFSGNTQTQGTNIVEKYNNSGEMTGPEVVHSFTSQYNGVVHISFIDKSPGMLLAIILPVCNEKTSETSLRIYNMTDTLITGDFYAIAGNEYFIVVDGQNGAYGDYSLKVDLPAKCPVIRIERWGKTDLCDGDPWPSFRTFWGYSNYQWYKDGFPIAGAVNSSFSPVAPGNYHLAITENGCQGTSEILKVRVDPTPDTAHIVNLGDTRFCAGGNVVLGLERAVTYPLNWACDGEMIAGATSNTYKAYTTGTYTVYTINGVCALQSKNKIVVEAVDLPAGEGEKLPLPSSNIGFHYTFTTNINVEGTSGGALSGYEYEPANDRFGGFWQARYLRGVSDKLYDSDFDSIPGKFSVGLWFKTITTQGGVMAAFYDSPWSPALMDAILYMSSDGKLHFWISNGGTPVELTTSASYNDDIWHCVLIQHDGKIVLEVGEKGERIFSAGTVSKQLFKGYWTFGGPALPAGVTVKPPSLFFKGTVDDLLFIREVNPNIFSYMLSSPSFGVSTTPDEICLSDTVSFAIPYTQIGTEYRVWNMTSGNWYTASGFGNGGLLMLHGLREITNTTLFRVIAFDTVKGCQRVVAEINKYVDICTTEKEYVPGTLLKVYPVPVREVICFEWEEPVKQIRIYNSSGSLKYDTGSIEGKSIEINVSAWKPSIYYYKVTFTGGRNITGKLIKN
jgi:hypothetical protein